METILQKLAIHSDPLLLMRRFLKKKKKKKKVHYNMGENGQMPISKKKKKSAFCPIFQNNKGNALFFKLDLLKIEL